MLPVRSGVETGAAASFASESDAVAAIAGIGSDGDGRLASLTGASALTAAAASDFIVPSTSDFAVRGTSDFTAPSEVLGSDVTAKVGCAEVMAS